jgi:hypothetical protein
MPVHHRDVGLDDENDFISRPARHDRQSQSGSNTIGGILVERNALPLRVEELRRGSVLQDGLEHPNIRSVDTGALAGLQSHTEGHDPILIGRNRIVFYGELFASNFARIPRKIAQFISLSRG